MPSGPTAPHRVVTLLTDFGTVDGYVAVMKGILVQRAPDTVLVDASHEIAHGDIDGAARALGRYWRHFPPGTVHLVVVDPGVGTRRRGLALEAEGRFVVAPDNGVATDLLAQAGAFTAVSLEHVDAPPGPVSRTFHGRDLFAPAAAHLGSGGSLRDLGPPVTEPVRLDRSMARTEPDGSIVGRVVSADRFGNLLTDVPGRRLDGARAVWIGGREITPAGTYGDVAEGETVALVNSDGAVEIAVRGGSAARTLSVGRDAVVRVSYR
jgi:hypothetical protein